MFDDSHYSEDMSNTGSAKGTSRPSRVQSPTKDPKTTRQNAKNPELNRRDLESALAQAERAGISVSEYLARDIERKREQSGRQPRQL